MSYNTVHAANYDVDGVSHHIEWEATKEGVLIDAYRPSYTGGDKDYRVNSVTLDIDGIAKLLRLTR